MLSISTNAQVEKIPIQDNNNSLSYLSKRLGINETFSLSGSLVSNIDLDLLNQTSLNNLNFTNTTSSNYDIDNATNIQENKSFIQLSQSNNKSSPSDQSMIADNIEQFDNLSSNLVSLLSGIIIQSLESGNPTINNDVTADSNNIPNNLSSSIIISGNWNIDVNYGNITNFDSNFIMISSNATGFHWHRLNNFIGDTKFFLGDDDTAIINGSMDFYTENNQTSKKAKMIFTINNLELIQIIFLDEEVASHFYGFPLYGSIDSIKIKN